MYYTLFLRPSYTPQASFLPLSRDRILADAQIVTSSRPDKVAMTLCLSIVLSVSLFRSLVVYLLLFLSVSLFRSLAVYLLLFLSMSILRSYSFSISI